MKKTLIATAIAGAMSFTAVAQAAEVDYDLYGSLRVKAESAKDKSLHIKDNSSRIGIKASTQLDGGITGIARLEFKTNTETADTGSGRLAYIGATGDFGTVTAGRQWTPQYLWTSSKVDLLDHGSNPTHSYTYAGRQGNTLAYISPDLGGLQLAAVVIAQGGNEDVATEAPVFSLNPETGAIESKAATNKEDEFDAYNLAAHFATGGFSVGVASVMFQNDIDKNYTTVAASYEMGPAYIAVDITDNGITNEETFEVAGSYSMGKATALANFVSFEKGEQVAAEVQYKLGAKSRVAATVVVADSDAEANNKSTDSLAVSWRVDF